MGHHGPVPLEFSGRSGFHGDQSAVLTKEEKGRKTCAFPVCLGKQGLWLPPGWVLRVQHRAGQGHSDGSPRGDGGRPDAGNPEPGLLSSGEQD